MSATLSRRFLECEPGILCVCGALNDTERPVCNLVCEIADSPCGVERYDILPFIPCHVVPFKYLPLPGDFLTLRAPM